MTPTAPTSRNGHRETGEPRNVTVSIIASLFLLLVFVVVALIT
jgi:hypothetical protein